jgi:magnesium transporter
MPWHDLTDPNSPELDRLAAEYHLHPLHIEDCRNRHQRAKVEENGYIFVVLKVVKVQVGGDLEISDLNIFLGADWVITVQEPNCEITLKILQAIHAIESKLRPDQILYRVCDGVIDSYLPILDHTDDQIDDMEDQVLEDPSPEFLSTIFATKRKLIELRRILVNTRDVTAYLYRSEHTVISNDMMPFLRDIFDHVSRNLDMVETQRDLLTGTMDVYLSSVANRTNQVMKILTILGTIALPVIVISGFLGMNTKGLPLTVTPHGTLIATVLMVVSTAVLLFILKRFRWF